jgi:hypothetical protein
MSALTTPGRQRWRMRDDEDGESAEQGSLFGESLLAPRALTARPNTALQPAERTGAPRTPDATPAGDFHAPRSAASSLDGPSLDDVITRLW